jgi:hypothetical protein
MLLAQLSGKTFDLKFDLNECCVWLSDCVFSGVLEQCLLDVMWCGVVLCCVVLCCVVSLLCELLNILQVGKALAGVATAFGQARARVCGAVGGRRL